MSWPITRAQVLAKCRKNLGLGESPDGSNKNRITAAYGLVGPWCAMAVWDEFMPAVDLRKQLTSQWAATTEGAAAAKRAGLWHDGAAGLTSGDVVFYKVPGGDAGFVNNVGVYDTDGYSYDGNWSNRYQRIRHPQSWIVGYMRPPYAAPPKPSAPPSKPTTPAAAYYTVRAGDTLSGIAEKLHTTLAALKTVNPGLFDSAHKGGNEIQPGERVNLPRPAAKPSSYVVRRGDTLGGIAKANGLTLSALNKLNPGLFNAAHKGGNEIQPGERVKLR